MARKNSACWDVILRGKKQNDERREWGEWRGGEESDGERVRGVRGGVSDSGEVILATTIRERERRGGEEGVKGWRAIEWDIGE